jgi:ABC-type xylose transport system permease subunit
MNKFSCWLVGINDQEYKSFVAKDKKDFKNFSTIIPIVLIIEFFGILNATHYILNKNYLISFFAALTWTFY